MAPPAVHGVGRLLGAEETGRERLPGLYAVSCREFWERGRIIEGGIVRAAFEEDRVREVTMELSLEGDGGTQVQGPCVQTLTDEFPNECFSRTRRCVKHNHLCSGVELFEDTGESFLLVRANGICPWWEGNDHSWLDETQGQG